MQMMVLICQNQEPWSEEFGLEMNHTSSTSCEKTDVPLKKLATVDALSNSSSLFDFRGHDRRSPTFGLHHAKHIK